MFRTFWQSNNDRRIVLAFLYVYKSETTSVRHMDIIWTFIFVVIIPMSQSLSINYVVMDEIKWIAVENV